MTIGEFIKKRRSDLGLTLEEIGRATGVEKSTVKKWESGNISNMRRDRIGNLAKILQIDPYVLVIADDIEDYTAAIRKAPVESTAEALLDPVTAEIVQISQSMTDEQRAALLQFVRAFAAQK